MKVFTTNRFTGFWPVGSAAVMVAEDQTAAAALLNDALRAISLPGDAKPDDCEEVDTRFPHIHILCDGNY